jgi:hypothetical protein
LNVRCNTENKKISLGSDFCAFLTHLICVASAEQITFTTAELLAQKELARKLFVARSSDSGLRSFVALYLESRPYTPHLAWVVDRVAKTEQLGDQNYDQNCDEHLNLRLRPGVFKPAVHVRTIAQKRKGFSRSDVIPFEELISPVEGNPLDLSEGLGSSPGSRFWLMFDAMRALRAFPECFLNPTFLTQGYLATSPEAAEQFRLDIENRNHSNKAEAFLRCTEFTEQLALVDRTPMLKSSLTGPRCSGTKSRQWWDRDSAPGKSTGSKYIQMNWLDWVSTPQVRFGVTWEFASDSPLRPVIDLVLKAMSSGQRIPTEVLSGISLTNDLLFVPKPWFEVNGEEVSFDDWSKAKKRGATFILPSGQAVAASEYETYTRRFVDRQKAYARMGKVGLAALWSSHVSVASKEAALSPAEYLGDLDMRISPALQALTVALEQRAAEEATNLDKIGLKAELRPYQKHGVATLRARAAAGLNLCLADEMGLGKTVQTIAFLLLVLSSSPEASALVVLPKSLLRNWRREFERFAPKVKVQEWGEKAQGARVTLITYARVRIAIEELAQKTFEVVVLDEGCWQRRSVLVYRLLLLGFRSEDLLQLAQYHAQV